MLVKPGDYTIERVNGEEYVINRSHNSTLRRTLINRDGRYYYIERPDWPDVHERRFEHLADLHTRLSLRGMRYISR